MIGHFGILQLPSFGVWPFTHLPPSERTTSLISLDQKRGKGRT
jgi:hypothetical protein